MALEDFVGGGGLAPSEPQDQILPSLPAPPFNFNSIDFSGLQSLFGGAGNLLSQAPQNLGRGVQQGSQAIWDDTSTAIGNTVANDITPFIDRSVLPPLQQLAQQNPANLSAMIALPGYGTPLPQMGAQAAAFGGQQLNRGLESVAQATAPEQGGYSTDPFSVQGEMDMAKSLIHPAAVLGQGVGHLLEDSPGIENDLVSSFQEGLSSTISNDPNADSQQQDAINKLLGGLGKISEDLFDPKLMHTALRDSFMGSGIDEKTANNAADYIATPLATIASFAAPGGMGKVMLAQFVGQLIAHPGEAIKSFVDLNPSRDLNAEGQQIQADVARANAGELSDQQIADLQRRIDSYNKASQDPNAGQATTGDFVNLFGKTAAWLRGQGPAPTASEVSQGFNALAYDVGLGFMGMHVAREGTAAVQANRIAFERGLTGQDPTGAKEVAQSGSTDIGQANQAGSTSQTSQGGEAPPAGSASSPQTPGSPSEGSRETISSLASALASKAAQGEGFPEANAQPLPPVEGQGVPPLRPDLGGNRPEQAGNYTVSGQGLNDDGTALVNHVAQTLDQAGLGDVVKNLHVVHGQTEDVAGAFSPNYARSIELDLKNAYVRPDPSEFIAEAQTFVSHTAPQDLKQPYSEAVTQGLDFVHRLIFSTPEQNLSDVAAHEALHAETWARTAKDVGSAALDAVPDSYQSLAEMAAGLMNNLKNSGIGQRWLAHDSTQAAIGDELKAIDNWLATGEAPRLVMGISNDRTTLDDPFSRFIEHFNSQLQWALNLSRHPYSLQAGDHAYTETFYNRERADEAAQLARQWFESTKQDAVAAVQSDPTIPPQTSGGSLYKRAGDRTGDTAGSDKAGVVEGTRDFAQLRQQAGRTGYATAAEVQRTLKIGFARAADIADHFNKITQQEKPTEAPAEVEPRLSEIVDKSNEVTGNTQPQTKPGVVPEKKTAATPPDWRQFANEVASSDTTHAMADLRSIGLATKSAFEKVDAAIEGVRIGKVTPDELHKYATDLGFEVARLRAAWELRTSSVASKLLDRDHPDYKQTGTIFRQIDRSNASPNEKAAMASLKMGMTLEEARNKMKDAVFGMDATANNWHPDFKNMLLGEIGRAGRDNKVKDGKPVLGLHNIPMHELAVTETLDDLKAQRKLQVDKFKQERDAIKEEISKSKMRQTVAGAPSEKETQRKLNNQLKTLYRKQALDAARLEAKMANHPDVHQSRVSNQPPLTRDEQNQMLKNPDPAEVRQRLEERDALTAEMSDQDLSKEAAGRNGRNMSPVPSIMGPESTVGEGRLTEDGRIVPPVFIKGPAEGQPFFGPDYDRRRSELRQYGDGFFRLANRLHNLMVSMSDHYDPAESLFSPAQQATAFWQRATVEVPWHVDKIEQALGEVVKKLKRPGESDAEVGRRILRPIDNLNESERLKALSMLRPEEAAVSNMLHEYWKASKLPLIDDEFGKPVLEHYVNGYVPHIVLADPDGKPLYDKKGNTVANKWSQFAKERIEAGASGEPLFKTLDALVAKGYKVETDISKVFREHSLSAFKSMQIRNMFGTLGRNIYHSPDGEFVGYPVIHQSLYNDARAMKTFKGIEQMRHVQLGPGASVFNMFWVHPDVAEAMERLAAVPRWSDLGKATATILRGMADVFKLAQFSINPSHAARVVSNIGVVASKYGPGPISVWHLYNRANWAQAPKDRTLLRRINPLTRGREDFAITQVAKAEKGLNDMRQRLAKLGFDPDQPLDPDHPDFKKLAPIYDQLNEAGEKLRMEGEHWANVLHERDQSMLSELMGKGLTLPREIVDASGQGWAGNLTEHIPGLAQFHHWMWKDVVWNGMAGLALHMSDQHFIQTAKEFHGWDGQGGAATAESLLTPQERDAAMRQAVNDAKLATGILAKSDMSLAWQTWGRAVLLSAPWTLSQYRAARDAMAGSGAIGRKLGRPDMTHVSEKMIQSGFDQRHARFFDGLHTQIARRMLFGGALKMAMSMAVMQPVISFMLTGQPTNMIQNFQKDPTHTFDIWAGRDPATGKDLWLASGFFGWQREMAEYGLTAIKASMEGKSVGEVATAPLLRFTNKNNPLGRLSLEMITGQEIGKWMNGWSDSSITGDPDVQALHQALDGLGLPDGGNTEDKLIYLLRTMAPQPTFPSPVPVARDAAGHEIKDTATGRPIPLYTDLKSITNQMLNPGQFGDPMRTAAYIMGAQESESSSLANVAQSQATGQQIQETQAQTLLRNKAMADLNRAFIAGDMQKVQQIRDANGLSDGQVTQAIEFGNSYNVNGSTVTTKGILSGQGSTNANKPITIGGKVLDPQEKTAYESDLSNRQIYVDYQLAHNPDFIAASATERSSMINNVKALAQRWTDAEWDYKLNGNGSPVTNDQFVQLVGESIANRQVVKMALYRSPDFTSATDMEKQKMIDSYSTFANTVAWDQLYGGNKGIPPEKLPFIIMNAVTSEQRAKDYLGQTQFYQAAPQAEQQRMINEYSTFTRQSALNIANGKLRGVNPATLSYYVQNVINTEESAKFLLHQSDFYQLAPLATQKSLDTKYQTLARTMATTGWQSGSANLNESQTAQAFEVGDDRAILAHLMADQAFNDLQNQYGGSDKIKAYADELSALQKQVRTTTTASPKTINYLANQVRKQFLNQNPQYAAYLQARTNWERGSQLGQLYSALNADDQALAAVDTSMLENSTGVAAPLNDLVNNSFDAITSPDPMALDTVVDPNSITPYVDVSSPGLDATAGG